MAVKGEAIVTLTLKDGGTISGTRKQLEALNKTTDKTVANQGRLATGSNRTKRGFEGVSQRANNTSKDFARMSQGMGGLVQAYATVAANVFALSTAFRVLTDATNFQDMISSARNLSAELGTSFLTTAVAIQKATKAQIDFKTALRAANKASASGISAKNVTKFAEAAAKSAQTFGGTTTDALNRMVTAILQGETELLKEVGIVISSNEAFLQYGITIGKAANELTSFEKRQALSNAVLKESERLFAGTEIQVNNFEVLGSVLQDNAQKILKFVNNSLRVSDVIGQIADSLPLMGLGVAFFARTLARTLTPSLDEVIKKSKSTAKEAEALSKNARKREVEIRKAGGQEILNVEIKKSEAILAQTKIANQKELAELKKSGQLKAAAFRKGSTLQKAAAGEAITQRGVNSLNSRNVSLQTRRKSATDVGFNKAARDAVIKSIQAQAQAQKELDALTKKGINTEKSLAIQIKLSSEARKAALAATKANIASSKAFALSVTQESGALGTFSKIISIGTTRVKILSAAAKEAGVSLTFFQNAVARTTVGLVLFGQAISKAFSFLVSASLVIGTVFIALDLLGIELFKQSKAEKAVEDSTLRMSEAFEESATTLEGMIKSFKRFEDLAPDLLFQKSSIAIGNFLQEIGGNFTSAIDVSISKLNQFEIALQVQIKTQERLETATNRAAIAADKQFGRGRGSSIAILNTIKNNKARLKVQEEIEIANKAVEDSTISEAQAVAIVSKSFIELNKIVNEFQDSGIEFPLLEKLKEAPEIIAILGSGLKSVASTQELFSKLEKTLRDQGKGGEALLKSVLKIGEATNTLGEENTSAGKAVEELLGKIVLFEGTATRLNKQVFKNEGLKNYADLIEQAAKTIKTLDIVGAGSEKGILRLSETLGIAASETREFVKNFSAAIENAGSGTLDRDADNTVSKLTQDRLGINRDLSETFSDRLSLLKQEETLGIAILINEEKSLLARKKVLEFSLQGRDAKLEEKQQLDESVRILVSLNNPANEKTIRLLERKSSIISNNLILAQRELSIVDEEINKIDIVIKKENERKKSAAFAAKEQAAIRQNKREISNLNLQILSSSLAIAKSIGDSNKESTLLAKIENARLERKKQDLAFDEKKLGNDRQLNDIQKEAFNRAKELLGLRKQIIEQQEKELRLQQLLRGGEETFKSAASTLTGPGEVLSSSEVFNAFMIEGAVKLKEELAKSNPLKTLADGVLNALDAAVDSLVSTLGTGDNDIKGIISAIDETLRASILDATSTAIKTELSKLLFGETLKTQAAQAGILSEQHLAAIRGQTATSGGESGGGLGGIFDNFVGLVGGLFGSDTTGADTGSGFQGFANGGIVHKPTFSMIGEGRNSEAVVPLPNNREIPVRLEGGTSGNTEVTQNFDFSGADAQTESRLRGMIAQSREGAFNDVFSAINRGGKFAKISGRR
jgi:hypothetical protein